MNMCTKCWIRYPNAMPALRETYDEVVPRKRVQFGAYRFVLPDPNFVLPKLFCHAHHPGADVAPVNLQSSFTLDRPPPAKKEKIAELSGLNKRIDQPGRFPISIINQNIPPLHSTTKANIREGPSLFDARQGTSKNLTDSAYAEVAQIAQIDEIVQDSDTENAPFADGDNSFNDDSIIFDPNEVTHQPARIPSNLDRIDSLESLSSIHLDNQETEGGCDDDNDSFYDEISFREVDPDEEIECWDGVKERHDMHGQFRGFLKDDGEEFDNDELLLGPLRHAELYKSLKSIFGHTTFRHRQKTAVTSILLGYDAFVLMPTGAGKSLCYQLPAVLSEGVTVVVSPLKSLIEDQTSKMTTLGIRCEALTAEKSESESIYSDLQAKEPLIKLLYVTPEKISASGRLASVFNSLHRRNKLSRFVIDEAHCVSQWGHDFRPDYTKLCSLRKEYSGVPIVALTATATPKIVQDTKDHLSIPNSKLFISSFVRDNLKYDLIPKAAKALVKVLQRMKQAYPGQSGIVYCLSRKECGTMAGVLVKEGISAEEYHAGMPDAKRKEVQHRWLANRVQVICATIAFGMGIDKPDVRFVVHYSLPKSIEGYYQETGRAGRDGLPAYCVLLYSYQDSIRLRRMVEGDNSTVGVRDMHLSSIYQMLAYAENISLCRRKILVEHFGEVYDAAACRGGSTPCDVCVKASTLKGEFRLFDVSEETRIICQCVSQMRQCTLRFLADLYRNQLNKKNAEIAGRNGYLKLPMVGRGAAMGEADALRLMRKLVIESYLFEKLYATKFDSVNAYAEVTEKGRAVVIGKVKPKVYLHVCTNSNRRKSEKEVVIRMPTVSEAEALKEKYLVKHQDVFQRALAALKSALEQLAIQHKLSGPQSILTNAGLEQIAALLPRTNSELLQADSMTSSKVDKFGGAIMTALKPFWMEVDDRDAAEITRQLESLKNKQTVMGGFAVPPPAPSIASSSSQSSYRPVFQPKRGRGVRGRGGGGGRGGAGGGATGLVKKKTPAPSLKRRGSAAGSGSRAKKAKPGFKEPAKGTVAAAPGLFPTPRIF